MALFWSLVFLHEKCTNSRWFTQIVPVIDVTILKFVPDNLVCFYTKNSQKVEIFSQIAAIIQGTILIFVPGKIVGFIKFLTFEPLENVPLGAIWGKKCP